MGSDAFFRMGSTHEICQDYTVAGHLVSGEEGHRVYPYVILSDGCSGGTPDGERRPAVPPPVATGAPYTDVGARLVVHAARTSLEEAPWRLLDDLYRAGALARARDAAAHLRLRATALDATLIVAVKRRGIVSVLQCGDGVIAFRERGTGKLSYVSLRFGGNMPFYPNYLRSEATVREYLTANNIVTEIHGERAEDGTWSESSTEATLTEISCCQTYALENCDLVLVMSDGVESFRADDGRQVGVGEVLDQLFAMKNLEGQFVARRAKSFLTRFCKEHGWKHDDDFSVGGIYLGEEPSP